MSHLRKPWQHWRDSTTQDRLLCPEGAWGRGRVCAGGALYPLPPSETALMQTMALNTHTHTHTCVMIELRKMSDIHPIGVTHKYKRGDCFLWMNPLIRYVVNHYHLTQNYMKSSLLIHYGVPLLIQCDLTHLTKCDVNNTKFCFSVM